MEMWLAFHKTVTMPLEKASIPLAITPGNHDASSYPKFEEERRIFGEVWQEHVPELQFIDNEHFPYRYAFTLENTLFVSLDDTRTGPLGAEQNRWLDKILETEAQTKIVFGHLPLYPFSQGREVQIIGDTKLEQLLNKHQVDMFLSGHHHAYYPGKRNAMHMVSSPCLGAGPRKLINSAKKSPRGLVRFTIRNGEVTSLNGWTGSDFASMIDRKELPEVVGTPKYPIWRDDIYDSRIAPVLRTFVNIVRTLPFFG